jgi:hypothetical protein
MLNVNAFDQHVVARLLDFFDSKTPWQRGLWTPGVVLTLKELLQASEALAASILTTPTLHNVAGYAMELVGRDPAFADADQKKALQASLRTDPKNGGIHLNGVEYKKIQHWTEDLGKEYLRRWATVLQPRPAAIGPERTARAIASHLLDSGFSSDYLHRWWSYKVEHEPGAPRSLSDLLQEAQELLSRAPTTYELIVAFEQAPAPKTVDPSSPWLTNKEVSHWLRSNGFPVKDVRQRGGVKLQINARDVFSAAEKAAEIIDRFMTRVSLGTYRTIVPIKKVWFAGEKDPVPLRGARRRIEVHALSREKQIYTNTHSGKIDAGMELAAPLNSELPSVAVAGGWAAIESLLTGPGDKERVFAADRMATITACSFSRAELTALSYKLEEQGGETADKLKACPTNRERAVVLADMILKGTPPTFPNQSDTAALARASAVLRNPSVVLRDIESHISIAFRRLYRHRNMVLHWGKTNAVGLRSCLRAAAPLVGAGLDRVAHAWFTEKCDSLELAARAEIRLATVGGPSGHSPLDLLESS